jgi:hypothetical protein
MVYLSHPVRRLSTDPFEDEDATLVLSCTSTADLDAVSDAVERAGGTVDARLQYHTLRIQIPERAVSQLTEIDGLESIETDNTVGIGGDAGEDV